MKFERRLLAIINFIIASFVVVSQAYAQPPYDAYNVDYGNQDVNTSVGNYLDKDFAQAKFFSGRFLETIDAPVTSNGTTIICSLEKDGGGLLTMFFSTDYFTILDTVPALTVPLTAGTDTVPKQNFIYIPQSTETLTSNITGFPTAEHIKVAVAIVQSAATVQTKGAIVVQFYNNHAMDSNSQGHLDHIETRLRQEHSKWSSGVSPTVTITTNVGTPDNVDFAVTAGKVYQLHLQDIAAFDTATGS